MLDCRVTGNSDSFSDIATPLCHLQRRQSLCRQGAEAVETRCRFRSLHTSRCLVTIQGCGVRRLPEWVARAAQRARRAWRRWAGWCGRGRRPGRTEVTWPRHAIHGADLGLREIQGHAFWLHGLTSANSHHRSRSWSQIFCTENPAFFSVLAGQGETSTHGDGNFGLGRSRASAVITAQ